MLMDIYVTLGKTSRYNHKNTGLALKVMISQMAVEIDDWLLTVEEVLQKLPGVDNVQVNGASAVARVSWSPGQGRPSAWLAALQRAGYGALPAGDMRAAAPRIQAQRMRLWRWRVAGCVMVLVMM